MKTPDPRIPIGTKWMTRGKHPRECTVIDIYRTINNAGECVKVEYLSEHEFMGQKLTHTDCAVTILKGMGL